MIASHVTRYMCPLVCPPWKIGRLSIEQQEKPCVVLLQCSSALACDGQPRLGKEASRLKLKP